jgi:hypothetical protein
VAPRARFELAIRRGELTAMHESPSDPVAPLACLEFAFTAHGSGACRKALGVKQLPRSLVPFRVEREAGLRVVVLGEAAGQVAGLANVGLALGVDQNIDEKGHRKMAPRARFELAIRRGELTAMKDIDEEGHGEVAPRARFELATLRLTAECSTVELPGNGATDGF